MIPDTTGMSDHIVLLDHGPVGLEPERGEVIQWAGIWAHGHKYFEPDMISGVPQAFVGSRRDRMFPQAPETCVYKDA